MFEEIPDMPTVHTEENPLILYSIVRKSLGMSPGKIAGQCQHAIQYFMEEYSMHNGSKSNFFQRVFNWKNTKTHTKIVLSASDKEWIKIKEEYHPIIVVDAGKTEIAAGSETVEILYPMFRDERTKTLKRLQTL